MPQTIRTIGTKPLPQLIAESIINASERYDKLRALGGFTVYDIMAASGGKVDERTARYHVQHLRPIPHSEVVLSPSKKKIRVYLPPGVEPPK